MCNAECTCHVCKANHPEWYAAKVAREGKKPHKHAETIKAWADGAKIEWRVHGSQTWEEINDPSFSSNFQYRIKPSYPTLGEIAKEAWSITATNNKEKDGMFARPKWEAAAKAVADAIKSGEYRA